jgi:hypothetical protein
MIRGYLRLSAADIFLKHYSGNSGVAQEPSGFPQRPQNFVPPE